MKQIILLLTISLTMFSLGCKNKAVKQATSVTDTTHFFSIGNFFLGEIKDVETTPYLIYQIITKGSGSKDSIAITKEIFATITKQFIACDISDATKKQNYVETAFKDNSTKSITLNYSTKNKDLPIQNIDILFNEETNTVNRIFIRQILDNKDSSITILYSWKANKSFTITKSIVKQNGTPYTDQQYVNWNDKN